MTRFDDALNILVSVFVDLECQRYLSSGVVLRDASGRLGFIFSEDITDAVAIELESKLRGQLGGYARTDRLLALKDDFGVSQLLEDSFSNIIVRNISVRLLDRRLVGSDWLRTPSEPDGATPCLIFASIKGGVGRSTALSIAAVDQASKGRRVLAVDLDMEAPGIGAMLLDSATTPEFGTIDALLESVISPLDDRFYLDLVGPSPLAERKGRIDVIPAFGKRSIENPGDILAKISRAYGEGFGEGGVVTTFLDRVKSLISYYVNSGNYDLILIDSRAGLHETTAAALIGLGGEVFMFGINEPQTFIGYSALLNHMSRFFSGREQLERWTRKVTMVQAKAESGEDISVYEMQCQDLFISSGLISNINLVNGDQVPLPADPFHDVPWSDDSADNETQLEEISDLIPTIVIFDDSRFKSFDPYSRKNLLSKTFYEATYGSFLESIDAVVEAGIEGAA